MHAELLCVVAPEWFNDEDSEEDADRVPQSADRDGSGSGNGADSFCESGYEFEDGR